jgi:hypothetical protein
LSLLAIYAISLGRKHLADNRDRMRAVASRIERLAASAVNSAEGGETSTLRPMSFRAKRRIYFVPAEILRSVELENKFHCKPVGMARRDKPRRR